MRVGCLLAAAGLGLLLTSCGSGTATPTGIVPVSKYKEMIAGKWDADTEGQLVQAYDFAPDGKLTMTVKGMKEPIHGTYAWTGDREVELAYQAPEEAKKDYTAAVKAYKQPQEKMAQGGGPIGDAVKRSLDMIPEELPAKEKAKVILGDKPHELLIVTMEHGLTLNFKRAK